MRLSPRRVMEAPSAWVGLVHWGICCSEIGCPAGILFDHPISHCMIFFPSEVVCLFQGWVLSHPASGLMWARKGKWRCARSVCRLLQHPPNTVCTTILPGLSAYYCKTSCLPWGEMWGMLTIQSQELLGVHYTYLCTIPVFGIHSCFDLGDIFRKKQWVGRSSIHHFEARNLQILL